VRYSKSKEAEKTEVMYRKVSENRESIHVRFTGAEVEVREYLISQE